MAPTNSYKEMLDSIDGWLEHQDKLARLEHQSGLHVQGVPEDLAEAIEEEKSKIAQLDADVASAAEQVIHSPFDLLEGQLSPTCRDYLRHARESIAAGDIVDDCGDCAEGYALLKLGRPCAHGDRAALHLFLEEFLFDIGFG